MLLPGHPHVHFLHGNGVPLVPVVAGIARLRRLSSLGLQGQAPNGHLLVLPAGHLLRISADDLVAAFYLFALPKSWSQLMAFQLPVKWRSLGIDKEGTTMVSDMYQLHMKKKTNAIFKEKLRLCRNS